MIINENNLKYLFLYKSFLFRFCFFRTDSNDDQLKLIVNALNIKKRKDRIKYIYDSSCKYIDDFYGCKDICGFKNLQCYVQRKKKNNLKYGCCRLCLYKSDTGCTTKNLTCKLFNCSEVYCRRKVLKFNDLKILKLLSIRQRIILKADYFSLREDVLKDLYSYSFLYSSFCLLVRIFINTIRAKKNS